MPSTTRTIAALFAAGLLVAACGAAGATPTSPPVATAAPPTPTVPAVSPTVAPTGTPVPTTDAQGPEHVIGEMSFVTLAHDYTQTKVGDVNQLRGGVATFTIETNDRRVNGTATWAFSVDDYGTLGPEWGAFELTNATGSWVGNCTGASWVEGAKLVAGCWLVGRDSYKGFTAYLSLSLRDEAAHVEGVIYPGSPLAG